jgi:hypothetical protein
MRLCVYNMIDEGRRGRKPGYIHEMGSHDLKSCEVKCQRNKYFANACCLEHTATSLNLLRCRDSTRSRSLVKLIKGPWS